MKRILAIEGGGIRGLHELEILTQIETLVREKFQQPLYEYFDFIAGTSTGAIIATFISWGYSIREIKQFYLQEAETIFKRAPIHKMHRQKYSGDSLGKLLKNYFREKDGRTATLGSNRLKTLLLIIIRNATTGSTWPICNNPEATFNNRSLPDCNLDLDLWELIRASTAAPTYFEPEALTLGNKVFQFVDGGISPYNNPSLAAFLHAVLPEYQINFPTGEDQLFILSLGSGVCKKAIRPNTIQNQSILAHTKMAVHLLINSVVSQQDMLCRVLGKCIYGSPIDFELGDLCGEGPLPKQFTYVRYNREFNPEEIEPLNKGPHLLEIDNLSAIPFLIESGREYAQQHVNKDHLL